ncbi:MAG TPA: 2-isopropylmalate synthase [Thermoleophilia bacterium]|mgnify:FL=1|nr:2-isopropylmalate synthase [Acidobacteriota bacterium]HOU28831.1 2-isopropylmalate synthase [Thermoleophilia bacterium]HQF53251.1 2-isopropylmalate synthase [Thermoleophilia bacterium]HQJ27182.1 2-isopropylmalate synthase [Thermoleophilia bacterium]
MSSSRYIRIFDTTLRDGEQAPGATLNRAEKLELAQQLARLRVDILEAGFPIASPDDFAAVQDIATAVKGPRIAGLARAREEDIRVCWDAVKAAEAPRIHTFISTSPVHMKYQIRKTPDEVMADTRSMVTLAAGLAAQHAEADVEFSAMDASRSDPEFLAQVLDLAVQCGATTINVPDTVGYALPLEFGDFIRELYRLAPSLRDVHVSVHCHDDLGLATANSLAAVRAGATQVECAVNGIGERAGNASLEEVVMALRTRGAYFECETGVETTEIARTSRLVSTLTGYQIQPNKAIVGRNAFAHESGIHQAGVLSEASTFEIMTPADVGVTDSDIVLGKHSGRHALRAKLAELGYALSDTELDDAFKRFKDVADKKKRVTVLDLEALVNEEMREREDHFTLRSFVNQSGSAIIPTTQVEVLVGGEVKKGRSFSNGSVESVFAAIDDAVGISGSLADYQVRAISSGKDSLAEVRVAVEVNGRPFNGQAVSLDVMEASAKAYVRAVNNAAAAGEV